MHKSNAHVDGFETGDGAIESSAPDTAVWADGQATRTDSRRGCAAPAVHGRDDQPEVGTARIDTDDT